MYPERRYIISAIFIIFCAVLVIRLFLLQVTEERYLMSAENNVIRDLTIYPARGLIFDRNGELLVHNEVSYDLMVVPDQLTNFDTTKFCEILDMPIEDFEKNMKVAIDYSPHLPSPLFKQLTAKEYAIIQEFMYKFQGIYVQTRTVRRYPKSIAAHVLGFVAEVDKATVDNDPYYKPGDYIGIRGIEKAYEAYLRGRKGKRKILVDVQNRMVGSYKDGKYDTAAVVGKNVVASLDAELQIYGERLMKNKRGSIVAIEPSTGEVLCLVTSPAYDPNLLVGNVRSKNYANLTNDKLTPLFNRAVMAKYPPGSTFKPVQALIGLQEGVIDHETIFAGGGFQVGSHFIHDHVYGAVNLVLSIQASSNTYYCRVYERLLADRKFESVKEAYDNWRNCLLKFGVGRKLNSDLPTELAGFVPQSTYFDKLYGEGRWGALTPISMAFGQGELGVTPFQMANVAAVIANRGFYYTPHVVKDIMGDGDIDKRFTTKNYVGVDAKHFEPVVEGMELVVRAGTATSAYIPEIPICGKTGTAQNPHGENHSVFIAFAPRNKPKIALAVYVENGGYGSTWAAPMASLMIEKYLTGEVTRAYLENHIVNTDLLDVQPKRH